MTRRSWEKFGFIQMSFWHISKTWQQLKTWCFLLNYAKLLRTTTAFRQEVDLSEIRHRLHLIRLGWCLLRRCSTMVPQLCLVQFRQKSELLYFYKSFLTIFLFKNRPPYTYSASCPAFTSAACQEASVSIALASPCCLEKCDAKLMLAIIIPQSQRPEPGRPSLRLLISASPPLHPRGLILHSAAQFCCPVTCTRLELIRHMLQSQTHENSNTPSQSVTSFSLHCFSCSNWVLHPDGMCVNVKHIVPHANTRMISASVFSSLNSQNWPISSVTKSWYNPLKDYSGLLQLGPFSCAWFFHHFMSVIIILASTR